MNSDPTGYFTLMDISISQTIRNTLDKIPAINYMELFNKLAILTFTYMSVQILNILTDHTISPMEDIGRGDIGSLFIIKMCQMKALGTIVSKFMVRYGLKSQWDNIMEAVEAGKWDLVEILFIQFAKQLISLSESDSSDKSGTEGDSGSEHDNSDGSSPNNKKPKKGKEFRGGSKKDRDKWYGINDKNFRKWWERVGKREWR